MKSGPHAGLQYLKLGSAQVNLSSIHGRVIVLIALVEGQTLIALCFADVTASNEKARFSRQAEIFDCDAVPKLGGQGSSKMAIFKNHFFMIFSFNYHY